MKYLIIYTDGYSTNRYTVDLQTGNIIQSARLENGGHFYNQWKFRGFRHVKRTSEFISLASIQNDSKVLDCMTWRYQNGRGQWRVCDLDHGTRREWGECVLGVYFSDKG